MRAKWTHYPITCFVYGGGFRREETTYLWVSCEIKKKKLIIKNKKNNNNTNTNKKPLGQSRPPPAPLARCCCGRKGIGQRGERGFYAIKGQCRHDKTIEHGPPKHGNIYDSRDVTKASLSHGIFKINRKWNFIYTRIFLILSEENKIEKKKIKEKTHTLIF